MTGIYSYDVLPPHFTGKERDPESGLDNFGARYNSSTMARFMSPDWSMKPATIPYADFGNPQSLNLYSYVRNNPLNAYDEDGHSVLDYLQKTATNFEKAISNGAKAVGNAYEKAGNAIGSAAKDTLGAVGAGTGQIVAGIASGNSDQVGRGVGTVTMAIVPLLANAPEAEPEAMTEGLIYRNGGANPANLTPRDGESAVSFRDSLSDPIGEGTKPTFTADKYTVVDVSKLPPGSAVRDNNPPGHVSVTATTEQVKKAVVSTQKLQKTPQPQ